MSEHSEHEWKRYILTKGIFGNALRFAHLELHGADEARGEPSAPRARPRHDLHRPRARRAARRLGDGWVCILAFGPLDDTEIYGTSSLEPVSSEVAIKLRARVKGPRVVVGRHDATLDDTPARSRVFSDPNQHRERPDCSSTTARIPEPGPKSVAEASEDACGLAIGTHTTVAP